MALTRSFKDTVKSRAARDPAFRDALLTEAVEQFLAGELDTGKAVLRDYTTSTRQSSLSSWHRIRDPRPKA